jgi:glycosyltransferase involved in cell wall biosynthesis
MRIGIDARYLSHGLAGGVHTYVRELVRAIVGLDTADTFILYADAKQGFELQGLGPRVSVRVLPWRSLWSTVVNDLRFARIVAADGVEVVHFPANYGVGPTSAATVLTLHDALNLAPLRDAFSSHGSHQTVRSRATSAYLRWWTWRSVGRADLVLTVSEYSRAEILRITGFTEDRVVAVPHGAPSRPQPTDAAEVRRELGLDTPFVLADALKNPDVLIRAWTTLPDALRNGRTLVFFARHERLLPSVNRARQTGLARLVIRPSASQLAALYSSADAFVFPSWIEGFGLPALEAMTYGAPLICSTRGSLPEVVGDAGRLVDPDDEQALAQALTAVLAQAGEAERLRTRGFERARQFTWQRTAAGVLDGYQRAIRAHRSMP